MTVSTRTRATHRLLHWEADEPYGPARTFLARRNVAGIYTGVTGVAATDTAGTSYTLGRNQVRADFRTDVLGGAHTFAGALLDATSGDRLSFPFNYSLATGPIVVYLRFVKTATAFAGAVVLSLGGASGARLVIGEYSATGYIATYTNAAGASYSSFTTTGATTNDAIELRVVLQAGTANVVRIYHAVNFQAEETGSASGTDGLSTLAASLGAAYVYLSSNAGNSRASEVFRAVMIDAGTTSTLASFRTRAWTMPTYPASTALLAEDGTDLLDETGATLMTE